MRSDGKNVVNAFKVDIRITRRCLVMKSSNEKNIKYRQQRKFSQKIRRSRRRIPKVKKSQKKDFSNFFGWAQIVIAIMSVLTPLVYSWYFSGNVEIANMEKIEEHNKKHDLNSSPAELVNIGWRGHISHYFTNNENKEQVMAALKNDSIEDDDEHKIGIPVNYCNGKYSPQDPRCTTEVGAYLSYSFNLKGTTKNPAVVTSISAVIDKSEDFSPEVLFFAVPQGSGENSLFGFNLGSDDLGAREVESNGALKDVHYLVKYHIHITEKDVVPITASFLVPPGKKIKFHLEVRFEGYNDPLIIKDGDKPFSVVSYPRANDRPTKTYVPVYVINDEEAEFDITQCQWYTQCRQMVLGNMRKEDVSDD